MPWNPDDLIFVLWKSLAERLVITPQETFLGHLRVSLRVTRSKVTYPYGLLRCQCLNLITTRISVWLSSAAFMICGQRSSVNVSTVWVPLLQSVVCSLQSAVIKPQDAFLGHLWVNLRVTPLKVTYRYDLLRYQRVFILSRICVWLSSAVFKICGQRSSVNVSTV